MSNEEKRWHWRCQCGQESPSYMVRCPRCNAVLNISAKSVPDDTEPEIPVKPPVVEVENWEEKPKSRSSEKKVAKNQPRRESREKPRRNGCLVVVILLLILLILLLGAVLVLLLKGGSLEDILPTQPRVLQTDPVSTMPLPSTDPAAQPTAPATTQPVVTAPPATIPPTTQPPETQPPTTVPPTTEPPETQPAFGSNMLKATIFDEEVIFKMTSARINNTEISVTYYAYNPRGEERYYLSFHFDKNFTTGSYNTTGNILHTDVTITFAHANANGQYYRSYRENGGKSLVTGTFIIERMSDDWMTYDGSFNVELVLYGEKDAIVIDDAVFNFTLEKQ